MGLQKFEAIDGLRAVAALSVVVHHIFQQFFSSQTGSSADLLLWIGWWGVTLFFVLSGFCIHYPNAVARAAGAVDLDVNRFARKRFFRIFPAYAAAMVASIAVGMAVQTNLIGKPVGVDDVLTHMLFIHNFWPDHLYSVNDVFWSIGVEVQFYVLYAVFYKRLRFTLLETTVIAALGLAWYYFASKYGHGDWRSTLQKMFFTTFWIWHLGAVIARHVAEGRAREFGVFWPAAIASLAFSQIDPVVAGLHIKYWVAPILCAVLVSESLPRRAPAMLKRIGDSSYSLYLTHPIAIALCVPMGAATGSVIAFFLSLIIAAASYSAIEHPAMRLKTAPRQA